MAPGMVGQLVGGGVTPAGEQSNPLTRNAGGAHSTAIIIERI